MGFTYESLAVARIEACLEDGRVLSRATGTWFRDASTGLLLLLTNWHVVTCRSPHEPSHSDTGAIPSRLRIFIHKNFGKDTIHLEDVAELEIPINSVDGAQPVWWEHPRLRHRFDVVAIPMPDIDKSMSKFAIRPVGTPGIFEMAPTRELGVTQNVFAVGYPWGLTGGGRALPLYKRGSAASHPGFDQNGLPRFLIDCRTAEGMSGSLVISDPRTIQVTLGNGTREPTPTTFEGVYSGRLTAGDLGGEANDSAAMKQAALAAVTEIGIVWKRSAILEMIQSPAEGWRPS